MRELLSRIKKKEWIFVLLMGLLVVAITAVPYLYGYLARPDNYVYTGLHHFAPGDTNVYLSMIEQVKQGHNVLINLYTSEPQLRSQISPFWLVTGYLARFLNLNNLLAFHVARSLAIFVFAVVAYLFISFLIARINHRKVILVILLFSSGLGWLFSPFLFDPQNPYENPSDMWIPESNTFNTLFHSPHMTFSVTLIVLVFLLMLLAFKYNKYRYSIGAGIACLLLLWIHPFNGPTVYGVLGGYILLMSICAKKIKWDIFRHFVLLCFIPLPAVLYYYLIYQADWVIRKWNEQNILTSPSVWMYIIGYGFLLVLLVFGMRKIIKSRIKDQYFLIVWFVVSAMLLYFPIYFQRRLSEGLHIPIAIMAGLGTYYIITFLSNKFGRRSNYIIAFVLFLIIFLPMSSFQVWGQDLYLYRNAQRHHEIYYLHEGEVAAMHWLRDNLEITEVIFSRKYKGNYIPAYSGRLVWIGHGPQTADLEKKVDLQEWFWQDDQATEEKYQLLLDYGVDYLYYSSYEKKLGDYNPATKDYLEQVFSNDQVEIYKVL